MKYLALIRAIALLHQYQRPRQRVNYRGQELEYIEVTLDDIATANRLAHEVLGRSLDDLPPQTRRLLLLIDEMVSAECERQKMERTDFRFSRRDVRQHTKWRDTQLRVHLRRLEERGCPSGSSRKSTRRHIRARRSKREGPRALLRTMKRASRKHTKLTSSPRSTPKPRKRRSSGV
jgi:hypothetical protein